MAFIIGSGLLDSFETRLYNLPTYSRKVHVSIQEQKMLGTAKN